MGAKDVLERLDWDYHPSCQIVKDHGQCTTAASSTAFVHVNTGSTCADLFAYICMPCLTELFQVKLPTMCCPACDRHGVAGFLKRVSPIPVVTP